MIKLHIYEKRELDMIKALPWCGGATGYVRNDYGHTVYYVVFVKPRNLVEKYITKKIIQIMPCTFIQGRKAA